MRKRNYDDEIVSFDIAKLAYQNGFNHEIGLGYRHGDYYVLKTGELNGHCFKSAEEIKRLKELGPVSFEEKLEPLISAPTRQFLQKWLLKSKGYFVWADNFNDCPGKFSATVTSAMGGIELSDLPMFDTYEEALDNGLTETFILLQDGK